MFKKSGNIDFIDIPEMHRKKLISLAEEPKDSFLEVKQETPQQENFLDSFASIGAVNKAEENEEKKEDNVNDLKWRIENLEFKLDQLIEKVNSINK